MRLEYGQCGPSRVGRFGTVERADSPDALELESEHLVEIASRGYTRRPVAAACPRSPTRSRPFSPAVRAWFRASFEAPTDAQAAGWAAIASGQHTLIHAPTGSGKTLAAFLWCLDRLATHPSPDADPRDARAPSASCTSRRSRR